MKASCANDTVLLVDVGSGIHTSRGIHTSSYRTRLAMVLDVLNDGSLGDGYHGNDAHRAALVQIAALAYEIISKIDADNEQEEIDKDRRKAALKIVSDQRLATLDEAKRFAAKWIETAMQHAANEAHLRDREIKARELIDAYEMRDQNRELNRGIGSKMVVDDVLREKLRAWRELQR
jgi:hypothetical protein